jgi:hypothetical protein
MNYQTVLTNWVFLLVATLPAIAEGQSLHIKATATGLPVQQVVTFECENSGSQPVEATLGPYVIFPKNGKQPLYVRQVTVTAPAGRKVTVPGFGVCLDKSIPPAKAGYDLGSPEGWHSFQNTPPLPSGQAPASIPGIVRIAASSTLLTYPGTSQPFPYTVDYRLAPGMFARYVLEAEQAFETTYPAWKDARGYRSFFESTGSGNSDVMDQQVFTWMLTSYLGGLTYTRTDLQTQFAAVVAEQENTKPKKLSPPAQAEINAKAGQVWADIRLVGTEAKVLAPGAPD